MYYRRKTRRPLSRAFAENLPDYIPSLPSVPAFQTNVNQSASVVQRYEDVGDNTLMSDNRKFAVRNEGKPQSEMFVENYSDLHPLRKEVLFGFQPVGEGQGELEGMTQIAPINQLTDEQIEEIHCGDFTQKSVLPVDFSDKENDNAPKGSNLFAGDLEWGIPPSKKKDGNRGMWGVHYAPVIIEDGNDRGTYETAVSVKHASFRIYGSKRGQTFRFKTVKSDIELAFQYEKIDEKTKKSFLSALKKFVKDGTTTTKDKYLTNELNTIRALENLALDYRVDKKIEMESEIRQVERARKRIIMKRCKNVLKLLAGSLLFDAVAGLVTGAWTTAGITGLIITMFMALALWMHDQARK